MRGAYLQAVSRIPGDAWKVMLVSVVVGMGYFGVNAVAFNLYLLRLGYGPEFIGLLNGLAMSASAICSIPAGMAGRRWGLRRAMLGGYGIWTVMSLLLPQAELVPAAWRTGWLLATFTMMWMAVPLWGVNQTTYLASITGAHERQHAFALSRAISRLAAMAGSLAAGFLVIALAARLDLSTESPTVYRYTLYIAPLLYILILPPLWSIRSVEIQRATPGQAGRQAPIALFVAMAAFIILIDASEAAGNTYFNVYMDDALHVSPVMIGMLIAAANLLAVPAALAAPLFVARWGRRRSIIATGVGMSAGMLVLALAGWWFFAGLGFVGVMALASVLYPVRTVYHQEITAAPWRSSMSGVVLFSMQLGRAAVILVGGFMVARMGYASMFTAAALLTLAGTLFFWSFLGTSRRDLVTSTATD